MMSFTSGPWNEFNSMPSGKGKNSWEGASLWNGGGNSEIFYVHLYLVKWSNLTDMFQRGWFNHQRVHGMPRKFLCQIPRRPIQHPSKGAGFFLDPEFTHQHKTPRLQRQIGCICIYFVYMFFYLHIYIYIIYCFYNYIYYICYVQIYFYICKYTLTYLNTFPLFAKETRHRREVGCAFWFAFEWSTSWHQDWQSSPVLDGVTLANLG